MIKKFTIYSPKAKYSQLHIKNRYLKIRLLTMDCIITEYLHVDQIRSTYFSYVRYQLRLKKKYFAWKIQRCSLEGSNIILKIIVQNIFNLYLVKFV